MATEWRISDTPALEGLDPDGNPWPAKGHRLIRLERAMARPGWFEFWEFPVPKKVTDAEVLADPNAWA